VSVTVWLAALLLVQQAAVVDLFRQGITERLLTL
jgi:hypothetical protein